MITISITAIRHSRILKTKIALQLVFNRKTQHAIVVGEKGTLNPISPPTI